VRFLQKKHVAQSPKRRRNTPSHAVPHHIPGRAYKTWLYSKCKQVKNIKLTRRKAKLRMKSCKFSFLTTRNFHHFLSFSSQACYAKSDFCIGCCSAYRYLSWVRFPISGASVPSRLRSKSRLQTNTITTKSATASYKRSR